MPIDRSALPRALAPLVVDLDDREDTAAWRAQAPPHGRFATLARRALGALVSDYDANAALRLYGMHLLGTAAWRAFFAAAGVAVPFARLLDVGAGDGGVTATLAPLAREVVATETSLGMARRLRGRGYHCHTIDLAEKTPEGLGTFDVVALLNVLDRCARPRTLLERAASVANETGVVVVATPLPLSPHVHVAGGTIDAEERLPIVEGTFETCLASLLADVLAPAGLEATVLSRAPYLSRGDTRADVYTLDAALVVLRRSMNGS